MAKLIQIVPPDTNESPPFLKSLKPKELGRKIKVGLVQANVAFDDENNLQYYLPLSVGYLQAHAKKYLRNTEKFEFLLPIYKPENIQKAAERLSEADVAAYSLYVWNKNYTFALAREVKRRNPSVINIFGGPQVPGVIERRRVIDGKIAFDPLSKKPIIDKFPERVEDFHRKHPYIDIACHGEGENIFLWLLEVLFSEGADLHQVPSISFIDANDRFSCNPKAPRIGLNTKSLDKIPSPYLSGVFEPLFTAFPDQKWLGLYETNRGCPFACSWCDWGSQTAAKIIEFEVARLCRELEWFGDHRIEFIFCCDANFGILDRDVDIAKYAAKVKREKGYPHRFSVQNTKNRTENAYQVQKTLFEAGLNNAIIMALQSVNPETLKEIHRHNISHETYYEINRRFAALGAETMTELILGQPKETYDTFVDGVCSIIQNGQHNRIQFNNLSNQPNAELGDPEEHKKFGLEIVEIPVANIHGVLTKTEDEIDETQELIIATNTCSREDWARTRAFAWMTGFLYFNKVAAIPIVHMHWHFGIPLRDIFEIFSDGTFRQLAEQTPEEHRPTFPVLDEIRDFFINKARAIQNGDYEFCNSPEWLNIWWPPEEYMLIKLYAEGKLAAFYEEMQQAFLLILQAKNIAGDPAVIKDAIRLNQGLLKLPFQTANLELDLDYPVWDFYRSIVLGNLIKLEPKQTRYVIDRTSEQWHSFKDWCRKVIWWGNKKGAYLHGNRAVEKQIPGHY